MGFASRVLMIRPAAFGYNPQTAESNAFQRKPDFDDGEVQTRALAEFDRMVEALRSLGVTVEVIQDQPEPHTPDSVFPNNWFSTHPGGTLFIYPMEAQARRLERRMVSYVRDLSEPQRTVDLTGFELSGQFLEGTGSMILDHETKVVFACRSSRTNEEVLNIWASEMGFETCTFDALDSNRLPIYHTNVMMCLGQGFAVICLESVCDEIQRRQITERLHQMGRKPIEITIEQMNNFAGNMLQLKDGNSEPLLVMSQTAFDSLTSGQIEELQDHTRIASFEIGTIESCGGGSVRCMLAELY